MVTNVFPCLGGYSENQRFLLGQDGHAFAITMERLVGQSKTLTIWTEYASTEIFSASVFMQQISFMDAAMIEKQLQDQEEVQGVNLCKSADMSEARFWENLVLLTSSVSMMVGLCGN